MKVFTSFFGNVKALERCGVVPISIARWPPRGWTGPRLNWLAPTRYMLSDECSLEEYKRLYVEICHKVNPEWFQRQLQSIGEGKDVALLCFERPGEFCHRHMLADHLNSLGWDVQEFNEYEYKRTMMVETAPPPEPEPQKPHFVQLSLF